MRIELAPWGIDVVIVEPGSIATPFWQKGQDKAAEVEGKMDAGVRKLYDRQIAAVREAARTSEAQGIPPERVGEVVADALTTERPKTRYLVGRDAKLNARVRKLAPDRIFDRLISRELGLK
jgi:NAD(P)-dependent dehydrogenase (short-subunit alcohol dehydrogenase family)